MKITVTIDDPTAGHPSEVLTVDSEQSADHGADRFAAATNAGPPSPELVAAVEAALGASPQSPRPVNGVSIDAGAAPL